MAARGLGFKGILLPTEQEEAAAPGLTKSSKRQIITRLRSFCLKVVLSFIHSVLTEHLLQARRHPRPCGGCINEVIQQESSPRGLLHVAKQMCRPGTLWAELLQTVLGSFSGARALLDPRACWAGC